MIFQRWKILQGHYLGHTDVSVKTNVCYTSTRQGDSLHIYNANDKMRGIGRNLTNKTFDKCTWLYLRNEASAQRPCKILHIPAAQFGLLTPNNLFKNTKRMYTLITAKRHWGTIIYFHCFLSYTQWDMHVFRAWKRHHNLIWHATTGQTDQQTQDKVIPISFSAKPTSSWHNNEKAKLMNIEISNHSFIQCKSLIYIIFHSKHFVPFNINKISLAHLNIPHFCYFYNIASLSIVSLSNLKFVLDPDLWP